MATNPAQPQADPEDLQDGGADEGAEQGQAQGGGYCIEIHVKPDGSLSVSTEPENEEYAEDGGQQDMGKPAANIKEALTMALEIFKADGQMPDDGGADADLDAGFKSRGAY
jgi:hypothetical protein